MREAIMKVTSLAEETYLKILKINITEDTFEILKEDFYTEKRMFSNLHQISAYFKAFLDYGLVFSDDALDYRNSTSLEHLRMFFRKYQRRKSFWMMYRRAVQNGFHLCVMEMFPAEEYSDENQVLYLLIKDIDNESSGSTNIRVVYRALCENFEDILCLDPISGAVEVYRFKYDGISGLDEIIRRKPDYNELRMNYIEKMAYKEDVPNILRFTDLDFVTDHLKYVEAISTECRAVIAGEIRWYRIKFARCDVGKERHLIAVGITEITDEKRARTDFYRDGKTILIAEDNALNREILTEMLQPMYPILAVENGQEALTVLEEKHEEIALVITDMEMPVMNGLRLIQRMKADYRFSSIPVIAATGLTDQHSKETCLRFGADDYIEKPYNPTIIGNRVRFLIQFRESCNMINLIEKDPLTGLYTREFFYRHADHIISEEPGREYAVVLADIEAFREYNDRYGIEAGNQVLKEMAMLIEHTFPGAEISGRIDGDIFAIMINSDLCRTWTYEGIAESIRIHGIQGVPKRITIKIGIYMDEERLSSRQMCDRAKLALEQCKGRYGHQIGFYDEKLREKLNRQRLLVEHAEEALKNKEFRVFYQPKHHLRSDTTGGAEALVRWMHPELGCVSPAEFIPLFEQNGFIRKMDEYILDEVCSDLLGWSTQNLPVVPVSVNLSRRDFEEEDLAEKIICKVRKNGLDPGLIHFELTESAYSEDPNKIEEDIRILHKNGFVIELDDFGTGYSSITAIGRLDVNTVKLDRSIILADDPASRKNSLNYIIQFMKMSGVATIQEGVETRAQLERLRELDCDYVQGYYYSKPLPKEAFEKYLQIHPPIGCRASDGTRGED